MEPFEIEALSKALRRSAETVLRRPPGADRGGKGDDVLARLVTAVVEALPAVDGAGVLQLTDEGVHSRAPSAPWVAELDAAQAELAEGP